MAFAKVGAFFLAAAVAYNAWRVYLQNYFRIPSIGMRVAVGATAPHILGLLYASGAQLSDASNLATRFRITPREGCGGDGESIESGSKSTLRRAGSEGTLEVLGSFLERGRSDAHASAGRIRVNVAELGQIWPEIGQYRRKMVVLRRPNQD